MKQDSRTSALSFALPVVVREVDLSGGNKSLEVYFYLKQVGILVFNIILVEAPLARAWHLQSKF